MLRIEVYTLCVLKELFSLQNSDAQIYVLFDYFLYFMFDINELHAVVFDTVNELINMQIKEISLSY